MAGVGARHHAVGELEVGDGDGEGTGDTHGEFRVADAALCRLEPVDAAEGGGNADAAAGVGAEGEGDEAGGDGPGGAAGGAAGVVGLVVGVEGGSPVGLFCQ